MDDKLIPPLSPLSKLFAAGLLARAIGKGTLYINQGNITAKESAANAVAEMANDWERRLLGLHCGQVLRRDRHKAWAVERIKGAKYLTRQRDRSVGVVLFSTTPPISEGE